MTEHEQQSFVSLRSVWSGLQAGAAALASPFAVGVGMGFCVLWMAGQAAAVEAPKTKAKKPAMTHAEAHAKAMAEAQAQREKKAQEAKARANAEAARVRYRAKINELLGEEWSAQLKTHGGVVLPGKVSVKYHIRPDGGVEGAQILSDKESNPGLNFISLRALEKVEFPRMPSEVAALQVGGGGVPAGRLAQTFSFQVNAPKGGKPLDEKSPVALYGKQVGAELKGEWTRYLQLNYHKVAPGVVRMIAFVRPDGKVVNVQVVDDREAPMSLRDAAITTLRATKFSPMPPAVLAIVEKKPAKERALRLPCTMVR